MRVIRSIEYAEASRMVGAIIAKAKELQKAAVIAVCDAHGELIALARMDGAPLTSVRVAANKAYTAARERKPTKEIGDKVKHPEKSFDIAYYGDAKFVGWGGGVPICYDGEVVGAVGVSGLSSAEDVSLANFGLESIGGTGSLSSK